MSQEAERVYTINLGKVWLSPNNQRAKRAINMIREFATHHMKTEQIKIDQDLSQTVWKHGIRSPPRKIRVKMAKTEEGYVLVSPYEEEKVEEKVEEIPKEVKPKEPETKVEEVQQKVEEKVEEEKPAPKEKKVEKKPETKKVSEEKPKKSEKKKEAKPAKKSDSKKSKKK
ncbi:MAG: 50S ribosomal protein L31e [Thermoproteota archaeon]